MHVSLEDHTAGVEPCVQALRNTLLEWNYACKLGGPHCWSGTMCARLEDHTVGVELCMQAWRTTMCTSLEDHTAGVELCVQAWRTTLLE